MDIKIEVLQEKDWERYKAIRLASLRDSPDAFVTTLAQSESWPQETWQRSITSTMTHIASINEEDVGVARLTSNEDQPESSWLISMWVNPELRGCKAADRLVEAIILTARSRGFKKLALEVVDTNIAAIKLYKRHGFIENGITGNLPEPRAHISEIQLELNLLD